jgi:hypothetical protein
MNDVLIKRFEKADEVRTFEKASMRSRRWQRLR